MRIEPANEHFQGESVQWTFDHLRLPDPGIVRRAAHALHQRAPWGVREGRFQALISTMVAERLEDKACLISSLSPEQFQLHKDEYAALIEHSITLLRGAVINSDDMFSRIGSVPIPDEIQRLLSAAVRVGGLCSLVGTLASGAPQLWVSLKEANSELYACALQVARLPMSNSILHALGTTRDKVYQEFVR